MSDYTPTGNPATDAAGASSDMRAEFALIQTAIASKVDDTDIGVTVQAYDADLTTWAGVTPGTGVATALAVNVGSAGAFVVYNGAGGTPSSIVLTNATGTAAGLTAGNATTAAAVAVGGITGLGTNVSTFLATPSSANLKAALTDELGGASGKVIFAEGQLDIASGKTATVSNSLTLTGTDSTSYNMDGLTSLPQNSKSAAYTTVLSDAGKHILHPSSDNNARTFTIDSNANVAYPVGTVLTFINEINTVTIAITSDTLTFASDGTTGSRTLGANGIATAVKIATTKWIISGVNLT